MSSTRRFLAVALTLIVSLSLAVPVGLLSERGWPVAAAWAGQSSYVGNLSWFMSRGECIDREEVRFAAVPADPLSLAYIFPLGLMTGSHVTPVDHQYYYWVSLDVPTEAYPVYAPADGVIVEVGYQPPDYRLIIEHSCNVYTIWIHIEQLAGPLAHLDGQISSSRSNYDRIPISAGELFGYDGGTNGFDFSVHDTRVVQPGFVRPESYVAEPWKVHTVDPYDYFDEPVRTALLAKNLRQVEPLGGRLDHDIEGTLMGNWFVEGTNRYRGVAQPGAMGPNARTGYWSTHLAIAPDPIDPRTIIVSFPEFGDSRGQAAIASLDPHPSSATAASGLVVYELVSWGYQRASNGEPWGGVTCPAYDDIEVITYPQHVQGTVLLQHLGNRRMKAEAFPGLRASQVSGFTEAALIYER